MSDKLAQKELDRVFGTTIGLLGRLSTFHSVADKGLLYGVEGVMEELRATFNEMYGSGKLAKLLTEPSKVGGFAELLKSLENEAYNRVTGTAESAIEAGCIVFAHGILDSCVYGYLTVTSLVAPNLLEPFVEKKTVELSELKNQSYEQLRNSRIKDFVEKVERESLLYKLDLLHKIVPPKRKISGSYQYDRDRIKKLDDTRNKIVHNNDWNFHLLDFNTEYMYWNFLSLYLLSLIINNTNLKLSNEISKYWAQAGGPPKSES